MRSARIDCEFDRVLRIDAIEKKARLAVIRDCPVLVGSTQRRLRVMSTVFRGVRDESALPPTLKRLRPCSESTLSANARSRCAPARFAGE
jgi:hypothetical protein